MTEVLKILVVEGNSREGLEYRAREGLAGGAEPYLDTIRLHRPDARLDVAMPYAPERERDLLPLSEYDGFALTGSAVAWGAEMEEAKPYLAYLERLFAEGRPVTGSCWGLQTVAVLLGGSNGPNPAGREIGLAKGITLTEAGRTHFLFADMPGQFDSPCIHRDHVTRLPEGAVLLASNEVSTVQAFAFEGDGIDFAGFQYHPELTLQSIAAIHKRAKPLPGTTGEIAHFPDDVPHEVADAGIRTRPIANWLDHVERRKRARISTVPDQSQTA